MSTKDLICSLRSISTSIEHTDITKSTLFQDAANEIERLDKALYEEKEKTRRAGRRWIGMDYKWCTFCGSHQHDTKYCPHTWDGQANRRKLYCAYCGSNQHTNKYCPKVWGGNYNRRDNPKGDFID